MRYAPHDLFFWLASFFLAGVALASATIPFTDIFARIFFITFAILLGIAILYLIEKNNLIVLFVVSAIVGVVYFLVYTTLYHTQSVLVRFNKKINIHGIVIRAEHHIDAQALTIDNNLKIFADRYPEFTYGDEIQLIGIAQKSKSPFFAGVVNARHTTITRLKIRQGNTLKEKLFAIKDAFESNLKKTLPHDRAAFLTGLTFGTTEEFSKKFKDELRASGTTHLVALSGANIIGIMQAVTVILLLFVPRRKIFWPVLTVMTLFVIMTGAESSLVRAAVMSGIFLTARHLERVSSFRNALTAAAFIMVIYDPRLLIFDLGFQLSFVAIMGLAYLKPILEKISPIKNQYFLDTMSAQLAVMPVLYIAVGRATPWAIIPNLLIVPIIPHTVALGFITGAAAFIHPALAFAPAWFATILLTYEMAVVHYFAFGV